MSDRPPRPPGTPATEEERSAAMRALLRSAQADPALQPNYSEVARETGWSRAVLRKWWAHDQEANRRRGPAPAARPPARTIPVGPPPPAPRRNAGRRDDDDDRVVDVPEPDWNGFGDVEYLLWELAQTFRVRCSAEADGDYAAWARLQKHTSEYWDRLKLAVAARATTSGRTVAQVQTELAQRVQALPDALLEPFVIEFRRRFPGAVG